MPSALAAAAASMVISRAWLSQKQQLWMRLLWTCSLACCILTCRWALWRCRAEVLRPYSRLRAAKVADPAAKARSIS